MSLMCTRFLDPRHALAVATVLALGVPVGSSQGPRHGTTVKTLSREVNMGTADGRISDTCFTFNARLSAGDFFDGMEISETASGRDYRKGLSAVNEFPPELTVVILGWPLKCGRSQIQNPQSAKVALESLLIKADWKVNLKARSLANLEVAIRPMSPEEWNQRADTKKLEDLGLEPSNPSYKGIWVLEATIRDTHIPLTDSLLVTLTLPGDKIVARFSARL